jgi:hypothetical protein
MMGWKWCGKGVEKMELVWIIVEQPYKLNAKTKAISRPFPIFSNICHTKYTVKQNCVANASRTSHM